MIWIAIYYTGLKKLSKLSQARVKEIIEREHTKFSYKAKGNLRVNIKEYTKGGKRKKYSVHIKAEGPFKITGTEASDWDLRRATHKAVRNIQRAIEHKYRYHTNPLHCATKQILGLH